MNGLATRTALAVLLLASGTAAESAVCNVQSNGVAFGNYDTLDPAPLDGVGSLAVQCDSNTAFTVDLGPGGATTNQRLLAGIGGILRYNLFTDATRTAIWGDGASGSNLSSTGSNVTLSIFGRIEARQNVSAGTYTDTVTITLTY
jgi:spore coat protein U-like protein